MAQLLDQIAALHREYREWRKMQGLDHRKRLRPDQTFRAYVHRANPDIYRLIQIQPAVLSRASLALQRDWRGEWVRPIGKHTLQRHVSAIARAYTLRYAGREQEKSFEQYMRDILAACACEEDLIKFLDNDHNTQTAAS